MLDRESSKHHSLLRQAVLLVNDEREEEIHIGGVLFALTNLSLLRIAAIIVPLRLAAAVVLGLLDAPHVVARSFRRCRFHACCLFIFARQFNIYINMILLKLRA